MKSLMWQTGGWVDTKLKPIEPKKNLELREN